MKTPSAPFAFLCLLLAVSLSFTACHKERKRTQCSYSTPYDSTVTYVKNDMVVYNGKSWYAVNQGRGVKPGPWLQDGNDVWKECIGYLPE